MELLGLIFGSFMFGAACGIIALKKGRRVFLWFILGCVATIISLVIILILPKKEGARWQA